MLKLSGPRCGEDAEEDFGINMCKLHCAATKGTLRKWASRKSSKRQDFKSDLEVLNNKNKEISKLVARSWFSHHRGGCGPQLVIVVITVVVVVVVVVAGLHVRHRISQVSRTASANCFGTPVLPAEMQSSGV